MNVPYAGQLAGLWECGWQLPFRESSYREGSDLLQVDYR